MTRDDMTREDCGNGLGHCHEVLVLHADGTIDCDGLDRCGGDALLHDWTIACVELACGCAGDERDTVVCEELAMAA